ncbi:MAG: YgiQ family radical SAM protein [Oscillospiraceae bacterium]|jgi:uncharacterized radical SAM protein YgiQ|nr:YgiQ family radical SAM protein [Oscillospiraceae bacterium]
MQTQFLPTTKDELTALGWYYYDFLVVTGDAYVDHPSFGAAVISRVLESAGYRVAVLAQPDWRSAREFAAMGRPRYGCFIGAGNLDSMVAKYTVTKKRRSTDAYSPGGAAQRGFDADGNSIYENPRAQEPDSEQVSASSAKTYDIRPDRASIVYCSLAREAFPGLPVILGGLEASLRRFAHYDYWEDKVRRSILFDAKADLLVYGMGETATLEIAKLLSRKTPVDEIRAVRGTAFSAKSADECAFSYAECAGFTEVSDRSNDGRRAYAQANLIQYDEHDATIGRAVLQPHGDRVLVVNPPQPPLPREEFDRCYELPYVRDYHPKYEPLGGVPGIAEVKFSVVHNRGCFGACNFCSLAFHQGRTVTSRSAASVVREAEIIAAMPDFKGYIHDIGGPTANFREPSCKKQLTQGFCRDRRCLSPTMCPNCRVTHTEYLNILRRVAAVPGVKKVFVRSGIRFDYLVADSNGEFFSELVKNHVSGQLKVAPEHFSDGVLAVMGKPENTVYRKFEEKFKQLNERHGKKQFLVPYLISSHPGCTISDAVFMTEQMISCGITQPEQVQDFYPTPGTLSTCMYYTGLDPYTLEPVFVPKTPKEKAHQRALLQWKNPKNRGLVEAALIEAGRPDLRHKFGLTRPRGRTPARGSAGGSRTRSDPGSAQKDGGTSVKSSPRQEQNPPRKRNNGHKGSSR